MRTVFEMFRARSLTVTTTKPEDGPAKSVTFALTRSEARAIAAVEELNADEATQLGSALIGFGIASTGGDVGPMMIELLGVLERHNVPMPPGLPNDPAEIRAAVKSRLNELGG